MDSLICRVSLLAGCHGQKIIGINYIPQHTRTQSNTRLILSTTCGIGTHTSFPERAATLWWRHRPCTDLYCSLYCSYSPQYALWQSMPFNPRYHIKRLWFLKCSCLCRPGGLNQDTHTHREALNQVYTLWSALSYI